MLVSVIGKFNAVKSSNNTKHQVQKPFSGDKNIISNERCKPHYDVKSKVLSNIPEKNEPATKAKGCNTISLLA